MARFVADVLNNIRPEILEATGSLLCSCMIATVILAVFTGGMIEDE